MPSVLQVLNSVPVTEGLAIARFPGHSFVTELLWDFHFPHFHLTKSNYI